MKAAFSATTRIRATPAQVFGFLADPATASVIDPAVVSYEPDGGFMGLGVDNRIRLKMLGIAVSVTSETIEWEPGRRMAFRSTRPARPVVAVATHLFELCAEGTLYTWSMDFVSTGFGGRPLAHACARLFERNAIVQQRRVRTVIEAVNFAGGDGSRPDAGRVGTSSARHLPVESIRCETIAGDQRGDQQELNVGERQRTLADVDPAHEV